MRLRNEDVYTIRPDIGLLAIADGVGGAPSGHVAARMAIDDVFDYLSKCNPLDETSEESLGNAIKRANTLIFDTGQSSDGMKGMATTLVSVVVTNSSAVVGHVGDSRAYLFRDSRLKRLTKDHSLVQEQLDNCKISLKQASNSEYGHVITRCVGKYPEVQPDVSTHSLQAGDMVLMCTDGISDVLSDSNLEDLLAEHRHNQTTLVNRLIESADENGSTDNMTAVVAKI